MEQLTVDKKWKLDILPLSLENMKTFQQIDLCWVSDDKNPLAASPRKMFQSNSAEHHHNGNLGPHLDQSNIKYPWYINRSFSPCTENNKQLCTKEKFSTITKMNIFRCLCAGSRLVLRHLRPPCRGSWACWWWWWWWWAWRGPPPPTRPRPAPSPASSAGTASPTSPPCRPSSARERASTSVW